MAYEASVTLVKSKEIELTPMTFNPKEMSELSWHEQSNRLVQLYAEILEESRP